MKKRIFITVVSISALALGLHVPVRIFRRRSSGSLPKSSSGCMLWQIPIRRPISAIKLRVRDAVLAAAAADAGIGRNRPGGGAG